MSILGDCDYCGEFDDLKIDPPSGSWICTECREILREEEFNQQNDADMEEQSQ